MKVQTIECRRKIMIFCSADASARADFVTGIAQHIDSGQVRLKIRVSSVRSRLWPPRFFQHISWQIPAFPCPLLSASVVKCCMAPEANKAHSRPGRRPGAGVIECGFFSPGHRQTRHSDKPIKRRPDRLGHRACGPIVGLCGRPLFLYRLCAVRELDGQWLSPTNGGGVGKGGTGRAEFRACQTNEANGSINRLALKVGLAARI